MIYLMDYIKKKYILVIYQQMLKVLNYFIYLLQVNHLKKMILSYYG